MGASEPHQARSKFKLRHDLDFDNRHSGAFMSAGRRYPLGPVGIAFRAQNGGLDLVGPLHNIKTILGARNPNPSSLSDSGCL
jgi:hypothetical protein